MHSSPPFHPDGTVNVEKLRALCKWHLASGTDGIVALGTTGESSTLSHEEDDLVIRTVLSEVGGKIPVIAGSGSNSTETALMKSRTYRDMGVDGILVITPYYNKANEKGMYRHFAAIADEVQIPMILYNVPGRTGCALSVPVRGGVIQAQKHRRNQGSQRLHLLCRARRESFERRFLHDVRERRHDRAHLVPRRIGASSACSRTFARARHTTSAKNGSRGDALGSRAVQLKYLDLINALFIEVNPIPVKEAMNLMGLEVGGYRMPLCEMDDKNRAALAAAMKVLSE